MSMAGKQMKTQNMPMKTEHAKIQLRAGPPALFILKSLYLYIYIYIYPPNLLVPSEAVDVVFNNCTVKKTKKDAHLSSKKPEKRRRQANSVKKGVLKQKSEASKETKH